MKRIAFLVFIFMINISAQDFYKLYEKILPSIAIDSDSKRKEVSNIINNLGEHNPELIYYYIEYLRISVEIAHDKYRAKEFMDYKISEFNLKLASWKETELNILSSMNIPGGQWLQIWTYLYLQFGRLSPEAKTKIDPVYLLSTGYRNYVVYLYYSGEYKDYQPELDYSGMTEEILSTPIRDFTYVFYNTDKFTDSVLEEYYDLAKANPFLFKNSVLDYIHTPVPVYLTEFLIKLSTHRFTEKTRYYAGAGISLTKMGLEDKLSFTDEPEVPLSLISGNINKPFYTFSFGAAVRLAERKRSFSLLNIDLSLGYNKFSSGVRPEFSDGRSDFVVRYGIYSMRVNPDYKISGEHSSISFIFRASTPIIYISSSHSIEAGVFGRYALTNYKLIASRNDKYVSPSSSYPQEILISYENKELTFSEGRFNALPWFAINSILNDQFMFRLSGTVEYFPQMDLFYRF